MAKKVLLADDESWCRDDVHRNLIAKGWEVITANDGREAIKKLKLEKDNLSAIILDWKMPPMGDNHNPAYYGNKVAQVARNSLPKETKIILYSSATPVSNKWCEEWDVKFVPKFGSYWEAINDYLSSK